MSRGYIILVLFLMSFGPAFSQKKALSVSSPDESLQVSVFTDEKGQPQYQISRQGTSVINASPLGLILNDVNFSQKLNFVAASEIRKIKDDYQMVYAKRRKMSYQANQKIFRYTSADGELISIVFQVSNDAVAFNYQFTGKSTALRQVLSEQTAFNFPAGTKTWLQPMQVSKSGWESSNPAYEEHYNPDIPIEDIAENKTGWVYPALFKSNNVWVLITEAGLDSNYCATRLLSTSKKGNFTIGFPDPREVITGKSLLPQSKLPFSSPWRVIAIGSLQTVVNSTAGTDLAKPSQIKDASFIKPGKSSWSWINSKDDFITYNEQLRYIDLAADMRWQYCLIDADWDRKIGYDKIQQLSDYAKQKNVSLLLWYNSAGDWNTVKYTPKNKLLNHEDRIKEFGRLKAMGIKGVKIDFFAGDGQSVIKYYIDILNDAAAFGLVVNFHGATLPRGWARTYPHLLTTEAVRGFENVTFSQKEADREAEICTMLPFTRNVFDPMDYTPMNLYKLSGNIKRKTSNAFELALSVLFLSGIQHYAESPEGMSHVAEPVKNILRDLPSSWDEQKFLDGYPGKYVVIARRSGKKWYIAGINSQSSAQKITLNLTALGQNKAKLIREGKDAFSFDDTDLDIKQAGQKDLEIKPSGGFLMVLE
ncbi:glycoside hydrolase family 97 protein [Pedobacter sp. MC2016-14]|uniref:glycoside hydrolase family 97 protein n=1 Tax=Pedobacter sp. MC2016-14 TaxID=2897327 RepID=UPI001E3F28A2|nr:glycoside hydrolase family 97 protein [Pedobacter sp. MC2016-14]MCD0489518.1 glycoside hydrolase family 97 protein [Pedobacter sp. MC2016-14]